MKKNVVILGSTGSIGTNTIKIFAKNKNKFQIKLLSTNKNLSKIMHQANEFDVKHIIIADNFQYKIAKKKYKNSGKKFYNNFEIINKLFKKKDIYYAMIAIVGLDGLKPTLDIIKFSKNIAIVNKEALICGWQLIKYQIDYHNTKFIPIDSEHFSLSYLIENKSINEINKIYITASGGPFLNYKKKNMRKISLKDALKHPNWSMGKKITIDSATMMNKVFEVIEAKNIFGLNYDKINILTHPKSYIHAIIEYKNGMIKLLAHKPDMKIPISNSILNNKANIFHKNLNLNILNNLELKEVDIYNFPLIKILKNMPRVNSLYETALVTINDHFVQKYLENKINFVQLIDLINKFANKKNILKYKLTKVRNLRQIYQVKEFVKLKLQNI